LYWFSRKVFLGLRNARRGREVDAGVPIRDEIIAVAVDKSAVLKGMGLDPAKKTVLVFGGSSGARPINVLTKEMVGHHLSGRRDMQLIHLCGKDAYAEMSAFYATQEIPCRLYDYFDRMGVLYRVADVIVSRAGALSVAELAFAKKPVVFIPYPYAENHQSENARMLRGLPDVVILEQLGLTAEALYKTIDALTSGVHEGKDILVKSVWSTADDFAEKLARVAL
jgi:UDP-N-acetylglucosamine--N-acetylmuramyl-(pentapeptide) pyrophosphoryl-undecaprenol N-acetylglucosamine transferase